MRKWEAWVAMLCLIGLGLWLVWGPLGEPGVEARPGAALQKIRVAHSRGALETTTDAASGEPRFRVLMRDGHASAEMSGEELARVFGPRVLAQAQGGSNPVFRLLNITNWASLAWVVIGFGGQIAFSGRTLLQWFVSEKERRSIVPTAFWWMSLVGGVMLFSYFAWRQEIVGVLGQAPGIVIYARNLRLIHKHKRRLGRAGSERIERGGSVPADPPAQEPPQAPACGTGADPRP